MCIKFIFYFLTRRNSFFKYFGKGSELLYCSVERSYYISNDQLRCWNEFLLSNKYVYLGLVICVHKMVFTRAGNNLETLYSRKTPTLDLVNINFADPLLSQAI